MKLENVRITLRRYANPERAMVSQRFFKTGKGHYGEGDVFIGVNMPDTREVAKQFRSLSLPEVQKLLYSEVHEERMVGVVIVVLQYEKAKAVEKRKLYEFYLKNVRKGRVNNWDLVDVTAPNIIGDYLSDKPRDVLFELARSENLWQRRVAILATLAFIKKGDPTTTLEIAEILLHDEHDLIHKAVGWMLREIGKRLDQILLTDFLDTYAHDMPRTTLRYAIEKIPPELKMHYMKLKKENGIIESK